MIMAPLPVGRSRLVAGILLGLAVWSAASMWAQDDPQSKRQLELMQAAVGSLQPGSEELKTKTALTFASKPLLRYSDPTRGGVGGAANVLLDASVWRLGTEGRPTALVTVEIYQTADASRILAFEFLSLSETKFALKHKTQRIRWDPEGSALALKELPDAPKPAATAAARLVQMRQLTRRFAAKELVNKESIECRLLPQPIDRYQSASQKIVDGAIFAYANGTNPELGLVFESDGEHWQYGVLRLTGAESSMTLDGRQVAVFDSFNTRGRTDGTYHSATHKIEMDK
jgi:hypothetical protein